jgi:hypothetical protein
MIVTFQLYWLAEPYRFRRWANPSTPGMAALPVMPLPLGFGPNFALSYIEMGLENHLAEPRSHAGPACAKRMACAARVRWAAKTAIAAPKRNKVGPTRGETRGQ